MGHERLTMACHQIHFANPSNPHHVIRSGTSSLILAGGKMCFEWNASKSYQRPLSESGKELGFNCSSLGRKKVICLCPIEIGVE